MTFHRAIASTFTGLVLSSLAAPAFASSILFIGNSFTFGDTAGVGQPVFNYRPDTVTDLNGTKIGGVPALFKAMTVQAGLDYKVSLETSPGAGVDWHYYYRQSTMMKPFDTVVLQSYSTLDASNPGNADKLIRYAGLLAEAFHGQNPNVYVLLNATWSRADQTYRPNGAWYGQSIYQMALDVRNGYDMADEGSNYISGVIPVGQAWNRAIEGGLADANPYDGIGVGQVNLWAPDAYHGSVYGYYLEALTLFGGVTGVDPRSLGTDDLVARDLGIDSRTASALQKFAAEQLVVQEVPEPGMAIVFATLGGILMAARRRRTGLRLS